MLSKLSELIETMTTRRSFIGRISARIVTLAAAVLGFTQFAEGACNCRQVYCCCLCKPHDPNCRTNCKAASGTCSWAWECYESHPPEYWAKLCYECFLSSSPCTNLCAQNPCNNVMCSQWFNLPAGFPVTLGTCKCRPE